VRARQGYDSGERRGVSSIPTLDPADVLTAETTGRSARRSATAPAPASAPPRRWWIPMTVGVAATAVVVVLSATAGTDPAPAAPRPMAAADRPAVTPSNTTAATVEVHLESTPPGEVFAAGSAVRVCTTPCAITIDPRDGGATDHRSFVIRRAGHLDEDVHVDLRTPSHRIAVALQPHGDDPSARTAGSRGRRPPGPAIAPAPGGQPATTPAISAPATSPPATSPSAPAPAKAPVRPTKVDPTDTLDPFR